MVLLMIAAAGCDDSEPEIAKEQTVPSPRSTTTATPLPIDPPAVTPIPSNTPTPLAASTPAPSVTLAPTPTATTTPIPTPTSTLTPTPTVKLVLDANATVAGYWSDRTADVELTVTLRNEGDLKFDDTQSIAVTCSHDAETVDGCGGELRVSLHDGYGPVSETLHLRVPMGEMSFSLNYGNGSH